jgi:putative transposase
VDKCSGTDLSLATVFGEDALSEGIRGKLQEMVKLLLDAELETVLAAARYARVDQRAGYRNGHKKRTIHSSLGAISLDVPRARLATPEGRVAEWQSRMLPRYQRRTRSLDATLLGLYLSGANLRRLKRALQPLVGDGPLGKSAISHLVQRLRGHLQAWQNRSFVGQSYVYLYLDATNLKIRLFKQVRTVPVMVVLGVRADGQKEVLALQTLVKENELAWKEVLDDLAGRGLKRPLLAVVDGNRGLRNALEATWPGLDVQRCVVHKLRNLEAHAPTDVYPEVKQDFHQITEADDLEAAQAARRKFVGKWRRDLPKVVTSLEEAGDELLTFYRYPREQWKCLRTTNPIERLNGEFKRRVKTQCSLPSQESALLLLFGLIVSGQIRLRKIDGWKKIAEVVNERRGIESTKRAS